MDFFIGNLFITLEAQLCHQQSDCRDVPPIDMNGINFGTFIEQLYSSLAVGCDSGIQFWIVCGLNLQKLSYLQSNVNKGFELINGTYMWVII